MGAGHPPQLLSAYARRPARPASPGIFQACSLIGVVANLQDEDGFGRVSNLVFFGEPGRLAAVEAERGGAYALPWTGVTFDPESDYLTLPETTEDIAALPIFDLRRMARAE